MRDRVRIDVEREKGIDELWKVLGVILTKEHKKCSLLNIIWLYSLCIFHSLDDMVPQN